MFLHLLVFSLGVVLLVVGAKVTDTSYTLRMNGKGNDQTKYFEWFGVALMMFGVAHLLLGAGQILYLVLGIK